MSETTIAWTERTWNPVRGCTRISPGCVNCYAERMAARNLPSMAHDGEPFAIMQPSGPRWTGRVELIPHMLDVPLKRRKPTTYFVNSMSDLFHERLSAEDIYRVFAIMELCQQHTFQILTKRADRLRDITKQIYGGANMGCVLPNVWLGVSCEDQQRADERIPHLLQTPAAVRFLSIEPLLGPVDLGRYFDYLGQEACSNCGQDAQRLLVHDDLDWTTKGDALCAECGAPRAAVGYDPVTGEHPCIDWVIVGGESGPGARPCDVAWIRSIVQQCKTAGVACFVKQLGARPYADWDSEPPWPFDVERVADEDGYRNREVRLCDPKGGDMAEWPDDLRVREMPR